MTVEDRETRFGDYKMVTARFGTLHAPLNCLWG